MIIICTTCIIAQNFSFHTFTQFLCLIVQMRNTGLANSERSNQRIIRKVLNKATVDVWYKQLEHASQNVVIGMLQYPRYMTDKKEKQIEEKCRTYIRSKHRNSPAKEYLIIGSDSDTIHVNICGPVSLKGIGRGSFLLTVKTVKHRFTRVK